MWVVLSCSVIPNQSSHGAGCALLNPCGQSRWCVAACSQSSVVRPPPTTTKSFVHERQIVTLHSYLVGALTFAVFHKSHVILITLPLPLGCNRKRSRLLE